MTSTVYVINRKSDSGRLASFRASAELFDVSFERIAAFDGHDPLAPFFLYKDLLGDSFWGDDTIKPGAFACYLSHIAAWRRLLSSEHEVALICEDDAVLFQNPDALISQAASSEGFDVVFANTRAVEWRQAVIAGKALAPMGDVVMKLGEKDLKPGDEIAKAPGCDCYLVSRAGAEALLSLVAKDKVIAGVDWMILRRSLGAAGLGGDEWAYLSDTAPDGDLRTFVAADAVAGQGEGESVIRHKISMPIAALMAQTAFGDGAALNKAPEGDLKDPVFAAFSGGAFYESQALEMMRRWMPEGGVFADIGAHVGGHTVFMLRHGGAGRAIPVEFNPRAIRFLTEMVAANDLDDRVDSEHLGFGLTEERGKREAFGSKKNLSNGRLREGFVEKIKTRPGDVVFRDLAVDMVKIDVNGDERDVLKGLRKTLKRKRPVLALDLSRPKSLKSLPLLGRLGYVERERAEWQDHDGAHLIAIFTSDSPALNSSERSPEN